MKEKWLCLGDIGHDIYELPSGEERIFSGGISFNHLTHLHRLGQRQLFFQGPLSSHSEDLFLSRRLDDLAVKKVNCESLSGRAPQQRISLKENGEKNFFSYEPGILADFNYSQPEESFDFILLPVFEQNWCWAMDVLTTPPKGKLVCDFLDGRDFKQEVSFLKEYANKIDLLVVGCPPEDQGFYEIILKNLGKWSKKVLVTRSHLSGFYFDGEQICHFSPIPQDTVVDSTGAGDAFLSSFLVYLCSGMTPKASLEQASVYAGQQIMRLGPH